MDFEQLLNGVKSGPMSLDQLEKKIDDIFSSLPIIDKTALRKEMSEMSLSVPTNPTTFEINEGLAKAQAYRDRLAEISILANQDYKMKKELIDMLFDAINIVSKASSAYKRKGEGTLRFAGQLLKLTSAEIFCQEVEFRTNNMKNIFDSFSRQGSMLALQVQLGEYKGNKDLSNAW
jgi:hypothetical protein